MNTDAITKTILLHASRKQVWRALSDSVQFGTWFGMRFDGPFAPGRRMQGVLVPTTVDAEIADAQKQYEGMTFDFTIEQMEPQKLFSFQWHPAAIERDVDYSSEPTTLVAFTWEETEGGVVLTATESGFDKLPEARRETAFRGNQQGWGAALKLLEAYLAGGSLARKFRTAAA